MAWLQLERANHTFEALDGEVRGFPGLSLDGKTEFDRRLMEMTQVLTELPDRQSVSTEEVYRQHPRFRWLVNRCLRLNGIDPLWVNWEIAEQLLFAPGHLIQLSQPRLQSGGAGNAATHAEIVAAMARLTSLGEAINLARTEPYQELIDVVEAYAKQSVPPDQQEDEAFTKWKAKTKADLQDQWAVPPSSVELPDA